MPKKAILAGPTRRPNLPPVLREMPVLLVILGSTACFSETAAKDDSIAGRDTGQETDADTDADTDTDTDTDADTDVYTEVSIEEVQGGLVKPGAMVRLTEVIVVGAQLADGFHVVTPDASAPLSGIWVRHARDDQAKLAQGDLVTITGEVVEELDATVPDQGDGGLTLVETDADVAVGGTAELPPALALSSDIIADLDACEPYEGMLVVLDDPWVSQGGEGSWTADDRVPVGPLYHSSTALTGATLEALVGLLWYEKGRFVVSPRDEGDLQGYEPLLDDCGEALCVGALSSGQFVISEVMNDPEAVWDDLGEWFEIYNPLDDAIDLRGLEVSDDDGEGFVVVDSVVVGARDWGVLATESDQARNGGVETDYTYSFASFSLSNGTDEIVLAHGGVEIDRLAWDDGVTFPDPSGASMVLDPDHLDAGSNDDGALWCTSSTPYGDGDSGTPGAANEPCGD